MILGWVLSVIINRYIQNLYISWYFVRLQIQSHFHHAYVTLHFGSAKRPHFEYIFREKNIQIFVFKCITMPFIAFYFYISIFTMHTYSLILAIVMTLVNSFGLLYFFASVCQLANNCMGFSGGSAINDRFDVSIVSNFKIYNSLVSVQCTSSNYFNFTTNNKFIESISLLLLSNVINKN